jgi:hypothetical protein
MPTRLQSFWTMSRNISRIEYCRGMNALTADQKLQISRKFNFLGFFFVQDYLNIIILIFLRSLFPCGDHMVCIIDDREDVWNFAPNLVHVKPYNFFKNTGDINAPPGSPGLLSLYDCRSHAV